MHSEKQHLIEAHLEPLRWTSAADEQYSDSSSELSEDASSVDGLWQPERLCQEMDATSGAESDARRLARIKLHIACAVSLVFMTGEVIGGYAAHSLAIMTDAAHLLTDFGSIMISIFSLWISSRPQTHSMTFGWHRAEILGMLLSVLSIWAVTAALVLSAVQRITDGDYDIDSQIMLVTSGCAVAVNILMVLILHQSGASRGHSHSFPSGREHDRDGHRHGHGHGHHHGNASVRAAFIHVVGDLVQSVGVLLAATIIHFWPEYKVADPICTFLFSVLVLGTTVPVTKDVFRILMEGKHTHTHTSSCMTFVMFDRLLCVFVMRMSSSFVLCRHSSGRSLQRRQRSAAVCERSHGCSQFAHVEPQHDSLFTLCPRGRRKRS